MWNVCFFLLIKLCLDKFDLAIIDLDLLILKVSLSSSIIAVVSITFFLLCQIYDKFRSNSIQIENKLFYRYYKMFYNLQYGCKCTENQRFTKVRTISYRGTLFSAAECVELSSTMFWHFKKFFSLPGGFLSFLPGSLALCLAFYL